MTNERRGWTDHPLVQLTLVRYREFFREPEAVFWVFVFPVLLTAGLGIAFRNQAPERTPVAVVSGTPATDSARTALETAGGIHGARALRLRRGRGASHRTGSPGGGTGPRRAVEYRYDRERPEAQTARLQVDDGRSGCGRADRSGRVLPSVW